VTGMSKRSRCRRAADTASIVACAAVVATITGLIIRDTQPHNPWGVLAPAGVVVLVLAGVTAILAGHLADRYS
jgi:hypothetical protein